MHLEQQLVNWLLTCQQLLRIISGQSQFKILLTYKPIVKSISGQSQFKILLTHKPTVKSNYKNQFIHKYKTKHYIHNQAHTFDESAPPALPVTEKAPPKAFMLVSLINSSVMWYSWLKH